MKLIIYYLVTAILLISFAESRRGSRGHHHQPPNPQPHRPLDCSTVRCACNGNGRPIPNGQCCADCGLTKPIPVPGGSYQPLAPLPPVPVQPNCAGIMCPACVGNKRPGQCCPDCGSKTIVPAASPYPQSQQQQIHQQLPNCAGMHCPACVGPVRPGTCCPDCSGGGGVETYY